MTSPINNSFRWLCYALCLSYSGPVLAGWLQEPGRLASKNVSTVVHFTKDTLHDAGKTFGDAAKFSLKTFTVQPEILVNVAKVPFGGTKDDVLKPLTELGKQGALALQDANNHPIAADRFLYDYTAKVVKDVGGKPGSFVFDTCTFSQRFYAELAHSSVQVVANT